MHAFVLFRFIAAIMEALDASGQGIWCALVELTSMAVRYATYQCTPLEMKLRLIFTGHVIWMYLYRMDRVTNGNNKKMRKGAIDGTMKFDSTTKIITRLNHMDFCLHAFPYQMACDISLGISTEMHHEKSELFRTASESRGKLRDAAPAKEHDFQHEYSKVIHAAGDMKESERMDVCLCVWMCFSKVKA